MVWKEWGDPLFYLCLDAFIMDVRKGTYRYWPTDTLAPEGLRPSARTLAEPLARQLGLRIWDVRFVKEGADWYLRVFIDRDGGVSIDDCVDLTRLLSPGPRRGRPDRPVLLPGGLLARCGGNSPAPSILEAYRGRAVTVRLIRPRDGQRDFTGRPFEGADPVRLEMPEGEVLAFSQKKRLSFGPRGGRV